MRKTIMAVVAIGAVSTTVAATNYFTGAVNNQTQNNGNWSLGSWTDWDDAVFADWATVRASGSAFADMHYNSVLFNAAINSVGGTQFTWNTAGGANNVVRESITVREDVTQTVRLGGPLVGDGDTLAISHQGSGKLEAYQSMRQGSLDISYLGKGGNTIEFGGGAVNSSYTGTTVLDDLAVNVIVNGAAGNGAFGHGAGTVELSGGTVLNLGANQVFNAIRGAAGSETRVTAAGATRSNKLTAEGDLLVEHDESNTAAMLLTGDMHIAAGGSLGIVHAAGARVTQLRGALTGSGDLKTSAIGTTMFHADMDASGFSGDVQSRGVVQFRQSDAFGSGTVYLNAGANFRGFSETGGADDHSFGNEIVVNGNARMATTGNAKAAAYTVTVDGGITFAETAVLTLEAGGNNTDSGAANVLLINGAIADGAGVGSIQVDNAWGGISFMNAATVLTAENTYSGSTVIQTGTLRLAADGSIDNSSGIDVRADGVFDVSTRTGGAYTYGGTVGGSGLIVGEITLTGNVNPGSSPGTLSFDGDLELAAGSTLTLEILGKAAGQFDVLANGGDDTLSAYGSLVFDATGYAPSLGDSFLVFSNWAGFDGAFSSVSGADLGGGLSFDTSSLLVDGTVTVIPEPASLALVALVGAALLFGRRLAM